MTDCLFCRIAGKEIPAALVYEDERTVAFLDIAPRAAGHTLVISRAHAPTLGSLPQNEIEPLFSAVQKVANRIEQVLHPEGLTIGINQGEASGQVVPHLHVHILPRFKDDGGGAIQSVVNRPPPESISEIAEKIHI